MLKIKFDDETVDTQEGTSQRTGKAYKIRSQFGLVQLNGEVRRVKVRLERDTPAYPKGVYEITSESLTVNNFSELSIGRLVLKKAS